MVLLNRWKMCATFTIEDVNNDLFYFSNTIDTGELVLN